MSELEKNKQFIRSIEGAVKEATKEGTPLTSKSEMVHYIKTVEGVDVMDIHEGSRFIRTYRPYALLPESVQNLLDEAKTLGYEIRQP